MADEFHKCYFCKSFDNFDGCTNWYCTNKEDFRPSKDRIIEKAKASGLSVADVIALINL